MSPSALQLVVAQLLLDEWDPLRAFDQDASPEHEYLHEAARVLAVLSNGIDCDGLTAHLTDERRSLTTISNPARDQRAADALLEWWSTTGSA